MKAESTLPGPHFYFQDVRVGEGVGVGGKIQLLGEDNEEKLSVSRHFSLQMEEVVDQESPLEENNPGEVRTCFPEVEEKEDLFSCTGPLHPLETMDL